MNESFGYDNLNRLTSTPQGSVSYDAAGNIQQREGKSYSYVSGSHRMQSMGGRSYQYDANGNVIAINDAEKGNQTLTYGIQNLPDAIQKGSTTLSYEYNPGNQRLRETAVTDQGVTVTWYLGGFEVKHNQDGGIEERHYLASPEGAIGLHTRSYGEAGQGISAGSRTRYWIKDHLGSVTAIADEQGSLVQRYRFDAWGRRTQTQLASGEIAEERGYTGHEQMTEVDLIHMNGRIYDPATGRMLQADPIIQSPYDGQNYNRYSYVLNNPLSLTDPTGFSFWSKLKKPLMMIAAAVAAYFTAGYAMVAYSSYIGTTTALTVGAVSTTATSCVLTGFTLSAQGSLLASVAAGAASGAVGGGNLASAVKGAIGGMIMGAAAIFGGEYAMIGRMSGGGINGLIQTGSIQGGLRGAVSGVLPKDLWLPEAYEKSAFMNIGIGVVRDGISGAIAEGEMKGFMKGAAYGQATNVIGHLVGFTLSGFDAPRFEKGAFVYDRVKAFEDKGAITMGNVISGGTKTLNKDLVGSHVSIIEHERAHIPQSERLGVLYLPTHAVTLGITNFLPGGHHGPHNFLECNPLWISVPHGITCR